MTTGIGAHVEASWGKTQDVHHPNIFFWKILEKRQSLSIHEPRVKRKIRSIFNAKMPSVYLYKQKQKQKPGKPKLYSCGAQAPPWLEEELVACIIKPGELILSCSKGHSGATVGVEGSANTNNEFPSFFQFKDWVEEMQSSSFLLSLLLLFFFLFFYFKGRWKERGSKGARLTPVSVTAQAREIVGKDPLAAIWNCPPSWLGGFDWWCSFVQPYGRTSWRAGKEVPVPARGRETKSLLETRSLRERSL